MDASPSATPGLEGSIVLVRQTDPPFPGTPVALRGTLHLGASPDEAAPHARIALRFPAAFNAASEEVFLALADDELNTLLATEHRGTYEYLYRGALENLRARLPVAKIMTPAQ